MQVTILWTGTAADAQGRETTWGNIEWVEAHPDELHLHPADDENPVVVDREYVAAYNRSE